MTTQGPKYPTSAAKTSFGLEGTWTDENNIKLDDGQFATCLTIGSTGSSESLLATGFEFDIPEGAEILGVEFEVKVKAADNNIFVIEGLRLRLDGGNLGDYLVSNTPVTTVDEYKSFGGEEVLFGAELTPEIVNSESFGVAVRVGWASVPFGSSSLLSIDAVRGTVYYNVPAPVEPPRSDDAMNLTVDEWVSYAQDYDSMQLDGGNGSIHLPCYDEAFVASIEAALPPELLRRVVFGSRGGRGCVG